MTGYLSLIPNLLSTMRLGLAFFFPFAPSQWWAWLIVASGASDFLDGWCARRWKVSSWQGGLLDAIADKLFMLFALLTFVFSGLFPVWWLPAILARDLTVAFAAGYTAATGSWSSFRQMDARLSGKLATAGQFLLLITVAAYPAPIPILLVLTVLCSLYAAADYGLLFYRALRRRNQADSTQD